MFRIGFPFTVLPIRFLVIVFKKEKKKYKEEQINVKISENIQYIEYQVYILLTNTLLLRGDVKPHRQKRQIDDDSAKCRVGPKIVRNCSFCLPTENHKECLGVAFYFSLRHSMLNRVCDLFFSLILSYQLGGVAEP